MTVEAMKEVKNHTAEEGVEAKSTDKEEAEIHRDMVVEAEIDTDTEVMVEVEVEMDMEVEMKVDMEMEVEMKVEVDMEMVEVEMDCHDGGQVEVVLQELMAEMNHDGDEQAEMVMVVVEQGCYVVRIHGVQKVQRV